MTGQEFRVARKDMRLTQSQLGSHMGVTRNTIWIWERALQVPAVAALAIEALRLSLETLAA